MRITDCVACNGSVEKSQVVFSSIVNAIAAKRTCLTFSLCRNKKSVSFTIAGKRFAEETIGKLRDAELSA
jgi:hypothetical protein